ncbi:hypothetical protein ACTHSU_11210, partial [Neisseria sp. P0009.S005]
MTYDFKYREFFYNQDSFFRLKVHSLNLLWRFQPVTDHIVVLPKINFGVFRGRRAGYFGAWGKGFDVAYHG